MYIYIIYIYTNINMIRCKCNNKVHLKRIR